MREFIENYYRVGLEEFIETIFISLIFMFVFIGGFTSFYEQDFNKIKKEKGEKDV